MSEDYWFNPESDPQFSPQAQHSLANRGYGVADYGGDAALRVEFEMLAVPDKMESERTGTPVYRDKEMIRITHSGGKEVTYREVREKDKRRFRERYKAWVETRENRVPGMPLEELPGLTASQIKSLQHQSILTVEQLASLPDTDMAVIGIGAHGLRQRARAFFERSKEAEPERRMIAELDKLRAEMQVLKERNQALEQTAPQKRGPGRPRKDDGMREEEEGQES